MKPCIICDELIKKKDSVLTTEYVCSDECNKIRKARLPPVLTNVSKQYWINQGMSEEEATEQVSKLQRSRSVRCDEYWIKQGFTPEEAKLQVTNSQKESSAKRLEKYTKAERQSMTPFSPVYWINRGYTEDEANEIIRHNSDNMSLEYFISKHGQVDGTRMYDEMCQYRKENYTLEGYIRRHGEEKGLELWSKKYVNTSNSVVADRFFMQLSDMLSGYKIFTASNANGEYGLRDMEHGVYYFYDFVIPELALCVEFNGDYWHCNPDIYSSDYYHTQYELTASEIWDRDRRKREHLFKRRGFDTIIVWESDDKNQSIIKIMEVVNEFRKS